MTDLTEQPTHEPQGRPPGVERGGHGSFLTYLTGLGFAIVLTLASFWAAGTHSVWEPAVPVLLAALAVGQMGVHVVFFFNIGSGPDGTNNFLALELREFASLVARGAGPSRSAFLSSFFTLVGCHGAHVTAGMLWLGTMMAQFYAKGFRTDIRHRFLCFTLFWHALDIIWVAIFSVVYLLGSGV